MNIISDQNLIISCLQSGQIGILPSDTIYGLMCRAADEQAVRRFYEIKKRINKLGTLVAPSVESLFALGFSAQEISKVKHYWPASLSAVITCSDEFSYLHKGFGDLAVRIPDNEFLQSIMGKTGPLLTTSANLPDSPVANTISEAFGYFKDSVDFYVDGGDLSQALASTIVRINETGKVEVLRQGSVVVDTIDS